MHSYLKPISVAVAIAGIIVIILQFNDKTSDSVSSNKTVDVVANVDISLKKQSFFNLLEPSVSAENQKVSQERKQLIELKAAFEKGSVSADDEQYARKIGETYGSSLPNSGITQAWLTDMLHKVNVLPKALVLTQAANESAWGTSRFATEANNYFGQWCYKPGCGLVPLKRVDGASHEVARFDSVSGSVRGYFLNINRNPAYAELRKIRSQLSEENADLLSVDTANSLTKGLLSYSERGQDYIDDLLSMIRVNAQYWK